MVVYPVFLVYPAYAMYPVYLDPHVSLQHNELATVPAVYLYKGALDNAWCMYMLLRETGSIKTYIVPYNIYIYI